MGLQPDFLGQRGGGPALETISTHGFRSRPRDPDLGKGGVPVLGAGLIYGYLGGEGFAWPTQDPRYAAALPDEGKGVALIYAALADGRVFTVVLHGENETLVITTPGGLTVEISDGEGVRIGGNEALPPAMAQKVSDYLTSLRESLLAATAAGNGATLTFVVPIPTVPDLGAEKLRTT